MKSMQQTDELGNLFENVKLSEFDVKDNVMKRIYNINNEKKSFFRMKKTSIAFFSTLILLTTSVVSAVVITSWNAHDSKGDVVLKYEQMNEKDKLSNMTDAQLKEVMNLGPKKIAASKPFLYKNETELKEKVPFDFKIPSVTLNGYSFKGATFYYIPNASTSNPEELPKDKNQFFAIDFNYSKDNSKINVFIGKQDGKDLYTDDINREKIDIVKIGSLEGLFVEKNNNKTLTMKEEIKNSEHEATFFRGGKIVKELCKSYVLYNINTSSKDVTKEDIISIAKSMHF